MSRSGLPALPVDVLLAMASFVKIIFEGDMEVGRLALKAEKTMMEVVAERGREGGLEGGVGPGERREDERVYSEWSIKNGKRNRGKRARKRKRERKRGG